MKTTNSNAFPKENHFPCTENVNFSHEDTMQDSDK